jgi:hypothetical protein
VNRSRQVDGNDQLSRVGLASQVVVVCMCQASQVVTRSKVTGQNKLYNKQCTSQLTLDMKIGLM